MKKNKNYESELMVALIICILTMLVTGSKIKTEVTLKNQLKYEP